MNKDKVDIVQKRASMLFEYCEFINWSMEERVNAINVALAYCAVFIEETNPGDGRLMLRQVADNLLFMADDDWAKEEEHE